MWNIGGDVLFASKNFSSCLGRAWFESSQIYLKAIGFVRVGSGYLVHNWGLSEPVEFARNPSPSGGINRIPSALVGFVRIHRGCSHSIGFCRDLGSFGATWVCLEPIVRARSCLIGFLRARSGLLSYNRVTSGLVKLVRAQSSLFGNNRTCSEPIRFVWSHSVLFGPN